MVLTLVQRNKLLVCLTKRDRQVVWSLVAPASTQTVSLSDTERQTVWSECVPDKQANSLSVCQTDGQTVWSVDAADRPTCSCVSAGQTNGQLVCVRPKQTNSWFVKAPDRQTNGLPVCQMHRLVGCSSDRQTQGDNTPYKLYVSLRRKPG